MSISVKTHKMLWGRSGNMCAFPNCKKELVMDESETDDASVIGEEAHIVGRRQDAARGISELTEEQRNKFDNLILLCSIHHKLIDDQENTYPVETLKEYKRNHENWVRKNLSQDVIKLKEDELYASYVDKFIELADVDNWKGWTSFIFGGGQPRVSLKNLNQLRELVQYVISRVWPSRYGNLEKAFYNFKNVANDFIKVFEEHSAAYDTNKSDDETLISTKKFYQIEEWNPKRYHQLLDKYNYHCLLVEDLALEMTRAANHIFDMVRLYLIPGFRLQEGVLLVELGPFMDMTWKTVRNEYKPEEKKELYHSLRKFMEIRDSRSYYRGTGVSEDYFITM